MTAGGIATGGVSFVTLGAAAWAPTSTLVGRCGTMERLETVVQPAAGGHLRRTPMKLSAVFSRFMQRF